MSSERTLHDDMERLNAACRELGEDISEALRLRRILNWLNRAMRR